jgi:hypothetical protein
MSVAQVYKQIINDVIENVKEDFRREGVSETVIFELKKLWETKLLQSGATSSTFISTQEDDSVSQSYVDPILKNSLQSYASNVCFLFINHLSSLMKLQKLTKPYLLIMENHKHSSW